MVLVGNVVGYVKYISSLSIQHLNFGDFLPEILGGSAAMGFDPQAQAMDENTGWPGKNGE